MSEQPHESSPLPVATLAAARRTWWVWLIPVAAVLFAAALLATYTVKRGPVIRVHLKQGHGIKATDVLRCRGIVVGTIETVALNDTLDGAIVTVRLDPTAEAVAREGSRFWIVRPRVDFSGVAGLETVAGPRYLAVLPGDGEPAKEFVALEDPPIIDKLDPGGMRVQLVADRRSSLRAGAPVLYRQFRIGTVLSVELADTAQHVAVELYVDPPYRHLIRTNTQFANVSGFEWSFGIRGAKLDVESFSALIDGGVAAFTPDPPGEELDGRYRFNLAPRPEDKWYEWAPELKAKPPAGE